jgi:pSer/pThr/pTyr-binding forkhead associated (FHA) protein
VSDATLVGLIKEIRRALDDRDSATPVIRTAHGVGYAFAADIQRGTTASSGITRWIFAGSRRIALNDGDNVIGRDLASAVHLDAAGISRRHARIVVAADGAVLEDLDSKNGTTVNEQAVTNRVTLHDGDRIQLGPVLIIFHASSSGMSTETIVRLR